VRQHTREDVVQALATLGVRLRGIVERSHFEDARTQALANTRALQIECHPDKYSKHGDEITKLATARFQSISLADHFLRDLSCFQVASLFSGGGVSRATSAQAWNGPPWDGPPYERPWKAENPGGRPVEEPLRQPECGQESPLGARCMIHQGHTGDHQGYGPHGRHSWRVVRPDHTEETVSVGVGE